jgi:uncharacterized membrane protein YdbT with pleckstrin-like domain
MARKKKVRRSKGRKINSRVSRRNRTPNSRNKIALDIRSLLLFVALSLVSLVLYRFIPPTNLLSNLFYVMAIVFGFVAVGLLIALLVLWILKIVRK